MSRRRAVRLSLFLPLFLLAGCGSVIRSEFLENGTSDFNFRNPHCPDRPSPPSSGAVEVRYLGSGGIYIAWGSDAVLVAPYFSRPGRLWRPMLNKLRFDYAEIAERMATIDDHASVRAILVGHSHFDHIGDVPVIVREYVPEARVYANDDGVTMLASYPEVAAESYEANAERWITIQRSDGSDSAIRFMPVPSEHAPQFCNASSRWCRYAGGAMHKSWKSRPDWEKQPYRHFVGGRAHAFVIDLLEHGRPRYRIYYNDAPAPPGKGLPPPLNDGHPYDLAVLCMATFNRVDNYPESIVSALRPRHVLISHYEDFLVRLRHGWRFVPLLTNGCAHEFMSRLKAELTKYTTTPAPPLDPVCGPKTTRWSMPVPQGRLFFVPSAAKD